MERKTKLFITCIIVYAFSTEFFHSTNEFSRFSLTMSIVDDGVFSIDDNFYYSNFPEYFLDKLEINGKTYSDKPPGPSIISFPTYLVLKSFGLDFMITASSENALLVGTETVREFITRPFFMENMMIFLTSGLLSACLVLMFFYFCRNFVDENFSLLLSIIFGFGTLIFVFASSFFDTIFTSYFLFMPIYLLNKKRTYGTMLFSGICLGWSIISSYYAIIFVIPIILYSAKSKKDLVRLIIPVAIFALVFLYYNFSITGDLFDLAYSHHSIEMLQDEGILKVPDSSSIINTLLDFGKIIIYSPVLIISIYMLSKRWSGRNLSLATILLCLLFLITSASHNPRFFVLISPFLIIPLIWVEKSNRKYILLLGVLSIVFVYALNSTSNSHSTFLDIENPGLILEGNFENIVSVSLASIGIKLGWLSLLPLLVLAAIWKKEIIQLISSTIPRNR